MAQELHPLEIAPFPLWDEDEILQDGKAYLLVETRNYTSASFFKAPTEDMREDWVRQREAALAEALEQYDRAMARYERNLAFYEARRDPRRPRPQEPVEPTNETFSWPDLELHQAFMLDGNAGQGKDGVTRWLYEVPEGEYVFYGVGGITVTDCACLGSVRFDVPAGHVTAVRIVPTPLDRQANPIAEYPDGYDRTDRVVRTGLLVEGAGDLVFDRRIVDRIRSAQFAPVPSLPNWFGASINRVLPIDGVFAYDGLQIMDLREQPTSSAGGQ